MGLGFVEDKQICRYFEELIRREGIDVETNLNLFSILFDEEILSFMLQLFLHHLIGFFEILIKELFLLGFEDGLQDLIDLLEVPHLDHPVSLIDHQKFKMLEFDHFLPQQFVQPTRSTDYDLGFSLPEDSQLLLFRHPTDNAGDF